MDTLLELMRSQQKAVETLLELQVEQFRSAGVGQSPVLRSRALTQMDFTEVDGDKRDAGRSADTQAETVAFSPTQKASGRQQSPDMGATGTLSNAATRSIRFQSATNTRQEESIHTHEYDRDEDLVTNLQKENQILRRELSKQARENTLPPSLRNVFKRPPPSPPNAPRHHVPLLWPPHPDHGAGHN